MIISVQVEGTNYDVEIEDINSDPIIARIGQERFEIRVNTNEEIPTLPLKTPEFPKLNGLQSNAVGNTIQSPIPGVINKILISEGQSVAVGEPLVVIEAMKMNNTIRANRPGVIEKIHVETGTFVKHHQSLITLAD